MADINEQRERTCPLGVGSDIDLGNSKGIVPPSGTAKPLMDSGGYVASAGAPEPDSVTDESVAPGRPGVRMSHVDEANRVVPKQRNWPK